MAHPAQLLNELSKLYPALPIQMWVYGVFNTTLPHSVSGLKGVLAASEKRLVFLGKEKDEQNFVLEVGFDEINSINFQTGPFILTCYLENGGYLEMSFISRGEPEGLAAFLEKDCKNSI